MRHVPHCTGLQPCSHFQGNEPYYSNTSIIRALCQFEAIENVTPQRTRVMLVPNGFCVTSPATGDSSDWAPCGFPGHTMRLWQLPPGIICGTKPGMLCCVSPAHQSCSQGFPSPPSFLREVCNDQHLLLTKSPTGLLSKVGQHPPEA